MADGSCLQELVEQRVFMRDAGPWQSLWVTAQAFAAAMSTVLVMPVSSSPCTPLHPAALTTAMTYRFTEY